MVYRNRWYWFIIAVALVLRLVAAWEWQHLADRDQTLFRFGDSHSYWVLAGRIAHGEPYEYGGENSRIFRAPFYPLAIAWCAALEHERSGVLCARYFGALWGAVTVGLLMVATERLANRRAALATGALAAFYPGAIGMSVFVLSEAVFCPLIAASLLCWQEGFATVSSDELSPTKRFRREIFFACSGLLSGLAALSRPSWILWPFCLVALLAIHPSRKRLLGWSLFLLAMILTMSPWWIRNYVVTGEFIPTTLQVGASLYDGWHDGASGASDEGMAFSERFASEQQRWDEEQVRAGRVLRSTMEYRLDRRMYSEAWKWAFENPSDVAELALIKCWRTWHPWPTAAQVGNNSMRLAEASCYLTIVLFGIWGWWLSRKTIVGSTLYLLPCLYYGALHMVFVGSVRYRQPAVLLLCVLAGMGLASFWNGIKRRSFLTQ